MFVRRPARRLAPLAALILATAAMGAGPAATVGAAGADPFSPSLSLSSHVHILPTVAAWQKILANRAAAGSAVPSGNGIDYHGGPVVMGEKVVSIYWASSVIYTGGPQPGTTGTGAQDGSLIGYFLSNLGGSSYYNINTTYTNGAGTPIPNSLSYTGFWANNSGVPASCANVSDTAIQQMIVSGFSSGKITYDPATIYTVFSAGTVNLGGGFGNCPGTTFQYCAYHGYFTVSAAGQPWNNVPILYAAMPYNAAYTGTGCTAFAAGGPPNGDAGADAEVNTLAHELEEANTDPQLNAWWTSADGSENADKCAWTFGTVNLNNNTANIPVGAKNFLVQRNWLNANGGSCQQSYAPAAPTVPGAPNLASANAGNAQVALSWTAPSSNGGAAINGYYVYRNGSKLPTLLSGTTFTDTGLTNGVTYTYAVTAHNSVGEGAQSNQRSATPATALVPGAPTLSASRPNRNSRGVQLNWSVPANNGSPITSYQVWRSTSSGGETLLTSVVAASTSYRDSSTSSGRVYYYKVRALNSVGSGPLSNEASATAR